MQRFEYNPEVGFNPFVGAAIGAVGNIAGGGLGLAQIKKTAKANEEYGKQQKKALEDEYKRQLLLLNLEAKAGQTSALKKKELALSGAKNKRLAIASTIFLTAIITSGVVAFLIIRKRKG